MSFNSVILPDAVNTKFYCINECRTWSERPPPPNRNTWSLFHAFVQHLGEFEIVPSHLSWLTFFPMCFPWKLRFSWPGFFSTRFLLTEVELWTGNTRSTRSFFWGVLCLPNLTLRNLNFSHYSGEKWLYDVFVIRFDIINWVINQIVQPCLFFISVRRYLNRNSDSPDVIHHCSFSEFLDGLPSVSISVTATSELLATVNKTLFGFFRENWHNEEYTFIQCYAIARERETNISLFSYTRKNVFFQCKHKLLSDTFPKRME